MTNPAGETAETEYDNAGRPIAVTDANGNRTTTSYDNAGRPIHVRDSEGGVTSTEYDRAGRPIRVIYSDGNDTITEYDNAGRPVRIRDSERGVRTIEYDRSGRTIMITDNDGVTVTTAGGSQGHKIPPAGSADKQGTSQSQPPAPKGGSSSFADLLGLEVEVPSVEYRTGSSDSSPRKLGGLSKTPTITLKRGITSDLPANR